MVADGGARRRNGHQQGYGGSAKGDGRKPKSTLFHNNLLSPEAA